MNNIDTNDIRSMIKIEYAKCVTDPEYFIRTYCYIQHPVRGKILFDLYPYQQNSLIDMVKYDYNIILKARQIGMSTLIACYTLWTILFNNDKNALIIATKQSIAKNMIIKIRFAFDNLPVWLQSPCIENNQLSLRFKNGSQVKAVSSSKDAGRSEALSLLVIDECLSPTNTIYIKNKETGDVSEISLGKLYNELSKEV